MVGSPFHVAATTQTYTDAVDRGYDCPACLDELKRRRGMTT